MKPVQVKWDADSNPDEHGWVYLDGEDHWQAVCGKAGRDREALPDELSAMIGYGLDVEFTDEEEARRGW